MVELCFLYFFNLKKELMKNVHRIRICLDKDLGLYDMLPILSLFHQSINFETKDTQGHEDSYNTYSYETKTYSEPTCTIIYMILI